MKLALTFAAAILPLTFFAQMDTLSHSLGIVLANSVKSQGLEVKDQAAFAAGFKAFMDGTVTSQQMQEAQMAIQESVQSAAASKGAAAKQEGEAFLAKNGQRAEVTTTASGLQYEVLQEGDGSKHPAATDKVTVHYTGKNLDGSVFDSSVERGQPATFPLNGVIAGWTEGVQLMTPGAKYRFYIPSELAYGDRGAGADIAPGATLMFDVELISIQ